MTMSPAAAEGAFTTPQRRLVDLAESHSKAIAVGMCLLCSCAIQMGFSLQPQLARTSGHWFADGGLLLNTIEQLLNGKMLYRDVFYQYGPLPVLFYAGWAKLFGNTIASFYVLLNVLSTVNVCLLLACLHRLRLSAVNILLAFLIVSPYFMLPGSPSGGFFSHGYVVFERMAFLILVLAWRPPPSRSFARSALLGVVIAGMQLVKFGSFSGAIAGLFIADLLSLWFTQHRSSVRTLAIHTATVVGTFLCGELLYTAVLSVFLPWEIVWDVVFPAYMAGSFIVPPEARYPRWLSLNYFLGHQLTAVVAILLSLWATVSLFIGRLKAEARTRSEVFAVMLLFPAFAVIALLTYRQVWHYWQGIWMICLASCAALPLIRGLVPKVALALVLMPCFALMTRDVCLVDAGSKTEKLLPNGERIYATDEDYGRYSRLVAFLRQGRFGSSQRVLILERAPITSVSHLHFFYGIPQATRHTMIFPNWIRPFDHRAWLDALDETRAVVLLQGPSDSEPPMSIDRWNLPPLPADFVESFSNRLDRPQRVNDTMWVFPVSQSGNSDARIATRKR